MISDGDDDEWEKMQIYIFSIGIQSFHYDDDVDSEDDDDDEEDDDNGDDEDNHHPC